MSDETQQRIAELEAAIAALGRQRHELGDTATDAAMEGLKKQLITLRASSTDSEQRRLITVLFSDLAGFTSLSEQLDPEEIRDVLGKYFERWKRVLTEHGGTVEKFIGDAVMAVFGVPTSHEDDPERAIRAALEMRDCLEELNAELGESFPHPLQMRVGIHTGPVVAKIDDTRLGSDLAVVGDTVNTANRIENAAPVGGILISHETLRHAGGSFHVMPAQAIKARGKEKPVQVYEIKGRIETPAPRRPGVEGVLTRMIGRETELQRMQDVYRTVEEKNECRVITAVGEAGVGKSRLFYEFHAWLTTHRRQFRLLKAHACREKQFLPYSLLRDMMADRCSILASDPPDKALAKLEENVTTALADDGFEQMMGESREEEEATAISPGQDRGLRMRAHFIGQLLGLDISGSPYVRGGVADPQQVRDRGLLYISDFLRAEARASPTVLLLEDLHWADESSLNALRSLLGRLTKQPILVVALARPIFFERYPQWSSLSCTWPGVGESFNVRLDLQLLERDHSERLVQEILQRVDHLPPRLRDLIVENTEGNPLFIEELIKMMIEDGVVVKTREDWRIEEDRLAQIAVPPTLTRILQARLDALPPIEDTVLKWASVMGRVFWDKAIDRVAGSSGGSPRSEDINGALRVLQTREMVFHREPSAFVGTKEFIFKHAMLREVAYERILKRQRRAYHAQAAAWLLDHAGGRLGEFAGLIAEHLEHAGEMDRALNYLSGAGTRAAARFANTEALRYFSRALELIPDSDTQAKFEILSARERVYDLLGDRGAQSADLQALDELARRSKSERLSCAVALRDANYARRRGDYLQAAENARKSLDLAAAADDMAKVIESRLQLGAALMSMAEYEQAHCEFERGLAMSREEKARLIEEPGGDSDTTDVLTHLEASAVRGLGLVAYRRDDYKSARTFQLQSLALCKSIHDKRGEALTLTNLGNALAAVSDYTTARSYHEDALRVSREIGDRHAESKALNNVGSVCLAQGSHTDARSFLQRSLRIKREVGDRPGESTTLANLAAIARDLGDSDEAQAYFREALAIRREFEDLGGEAMALVGLASVYQTLGAYAEARDMMEQALSIASGLGDEEDECYIREHLALLSHETGENDRARSYARVAIRIARSIGAPDPEAQGIMCLAHALAATNKWAQSANAYKRALAIRRDLGQPAIACEAMAGLARISLSIDDLSAASGHVEQILGYLETGTLVGTSQPFRVLLTCYRVLDAMGDHRAAHIIRTAHSLLLDHSARISDPQLRRSFLENVRHNREIMASFKSVESRE